MRTQRWILAALLAAFTLPASANIIPGDYVADSETYWEFTQDVGTIFVGPDFDTFNIIFDGVGGIDSATLTLLPGAWGDGGAVEFDTFNILTAEEGQPGEAEYRFAYNLWGFGHFTAAPSYWLYIEADYDGFPAVGGGDDYVTQIGGIENLRFVIGETEVVPEPASLLLLGIGMGGLALRRRLRLL